MSPGKGDNLLTPVEPYRVGPDDQGVDVPSHQFLEGCINFAFVSCLRDHSFKSEFLRAGLCILLLIVGTGVVRIHKQSNAFHAGGKLMQQLDTLRTKAGRQKANAGYVATGPVHTFDQTKAHRINVDRKYYRDSFARSLGRSRRR